MNTHIKLILTIIFCLYVFLGQGQSRMKEDVTYDIDGNPLCIVYEEKFDSLVYVRLDGRKLDVEREIQFHRGQPLLSAKIDSLFRDAYGETNELTGLLVFCILFDEQLNMDEVRIEKRIGIPDDQYDDFIRTALQSTQGKWEKRERATSKRLIYQGVYRVKTS